MKKQLFWGLILTALCAFQLTAEMLYGESRSFDDIFPNLPPEIRASAFSDSGYFSSSTLQNIRAGNSAILGRSSVLDQQIVNTILGTNPGHIVESLLVIPRKPGTTSLLDVYNALSDIRGLTGRLYHSSRRNRYIPLFEDATRLVSDRNNTAIPDPPPATSVPESETIFVRLRDANFGNSFYRAEMSLFGNGLLYRLSNYRNLTYLFIPVIREGNLTAQLYFEVIQEGILIYGLSGVEVADFFSSRVDIGSAISRRLEVIISWVAEGIENPN